VAMDAPGVTVRAMREHDAAWTADQHVRHLPHGLFPRLGRRFVERWHLAQLRSPHGIALVAELGGRRVGFLLGAVDHVRQVQWIIATDRPRLVLLGLAGLLASPQTLASFTRSRLLPYARRLVSTSRSGARLAPRLASEPVAVVQAVVVDPSARGSGAGRLLVEEFLAAAHRAGTRRAELVTKAGPDGASGFYESLGWVAVDVHRDRDDDLVRTFRTCTAPRPSRVIDLDSLTPDARTTARSSRRA
jgi:ribosomal protein S18 acetylase RimI-like enzyme